MSALSEFLVAANTSGHSARAIARAAQERGYSLNHDTAARYLRGDHGVPDEATLVALAEVLHVPLRELRRAANLPADITTPYVPPPEASRLTRRQRRAIDEIIRAMLEPTRTEAGTATKPRSEYRAARRGRPEKPDAT
jgi:transcriptional regulator with XRE-family HTH domain